MEFQAANDSRGFTRHSRLLDMQADLQQKIMRDKEAKLLQLARDGEEKRRLRLQRLVYDRNDSAPTVGSGPFQMAQRETNSAESAQPSSLPLSHATHFRSVRPNGRLPILKPIVTRGQTSWHEGGGRTTDQGGYRNQTAPLQEKHPNIWGADGGYQMKGRNHRPAGEFGSSGLKPPAGLKYSNGEGRTPDVSKTKSKLSREMEKSRLEGERRRAATEAKREENRRRLKAERQRKEIEEQQRQEAADTGNDASQESGDQHHVFDNEQREREELIRRLEGEERRKLKELEDMKKRHRDEQIRRFGQLASKYDDSDDEEPPVAVQPGRKTTRRRNASRAFARVEIDENVHHGLYDSPEPSHSAANSHLNASGGDSNGFAYRDGMSLRREASVKEVVKKTQPVSKAKVKSERNKLTPSFTATPKPAQKYDPREDRPLDRNQPMEFFDEETNETKRLVQCSVCSRRFAEDRIEKHEVACSKAAAKKRKTFDPTKQRLAGSGAEEFQGRKGVKKRQNVAPKKADWRRAHQEFVQNIRYAKQMKAYEASGKNVADLPPPPRSENPDYVQCPHCERRFNQTAAERHIPRCKDTKARPKMLIRKR